MRSRRLEHQPVATPIGTGKFGLAIAEIVARENTPNHLITRSETRIKQSIESFYTVPPLSQHIKKSDGSDVPSLSSLTNRVTRGR